VTARGREKVELRRRSVEGDNELSDEAVKGREREVGVEERGHAQ
jgi:hypothetical protein